MTREDLINEFWGVKCRCGKRKGSGASFCTSCYGRLDGRQQAALYSRMDAGYPEAYRKAVKTLDSVVYAPKDSE